MPAWTFERQNRELRFVVRFFGERTAGVAGFTWLQGINRGTRITPGDELAKLTWNDGRSKILKAPAGCSGEITRRNRRVALTELKKYPSQWALRLKQPG